MKKTNRGIYWAIMCTFMAIITIVCGISLVESAKVAKMYLRQTLTYDAPEYISITADANGGTFGNSDELTIHIKFNNFVGENTENNRIPEPTKEGYAFSGWKYKVRADEETWSNGNISDDMPFTDHLYLQAQWSASNYTVTLNMQSGSGGSSSTSVTYNSDMPSATMPTRTGYTFGGYYDGTNGSGKQYYTSSGASANTWDKASPTTLYAKWTANKYYVSFNANGGSGDMDNQEFTYDAGAQALTANTFTKTGYSFAGWAKTSNGAKEYDDGAGISNLTATNDETVPLYAKWTANNYSITYLDQGGAAFSGAHASGHPTSHTYDTATTLLSATKTGYTFGGWYTNSDCTGDAVTSLGATAYTANITLYAKWTINKYTVTVHVGQSGYGTVSPTSFSVDYGTVIFANGNTLRVGSSSGSTVATAQAASTTAQYSYLFSTWTQSTTNGTQITSSNGMTVGGNCDVYANFTQTLRKYTVTVVVDSSSSGYGTVSPSSITNVPYGTSITMNNNTVTVGTTDITATPTTDNAQYSYNFTGWNGLPNTIAGDLTITAYFTRSTNQYTLTVNYTSISATNTTNLTITQADSTVSNSSISSSGSSTVTHDYSTSSLTVTLARVNSSYDYYISVDSAPTTGSTPNSITHGWTPTSNASINVYVAQRYTISYLTTGSNSGTAPAAQYKIHGTNLSLASNSGNLAKTDYDFVGWSTSSNDTDGTPNYTAGATYSNNSSIILYPAWELAGFTVTIQANNGDYGTLSVTDENDSDQKEVFVPYGATITTSGDQITFSDTDGNSITTITATPHDEDTRTYGFANWSGVEDTVTRAFIITANFASNLKSEFEHSGSTLTRYTGTDTTVIIPRTLDGVTIETIKNNSSYCNIFTISSYSYNTTVTSVIIPSTVKTIGNYAFYNCSGLTGSFIIPDTVTSIGYQVFYNCSGLKSVTISSSVTSIDVGTFRGCSGLTSVTIPDKVTSIGTEAFRGCRDLTSVTIPESVTSIDSYAFEDCNKLVEVYCFTSSVPYLTRDAIGQSWCGCVVYYAKDFYTSNDAQSKLSKNGDFIIYTEGTEKYCMAYTGSATNITIPSNVTQIYQYAFYGKQSITSVTIPNSVTSIGDYAFYNCSGLKSVTIGSSVTGIGSRAFYNCYGLTSVTIPDSVTSIGSYAFYSCRGLTSITIGRNVTSIGSNAFYWCYKLVEVYNLSGITLTIDSSNGYVAKYAKDIYTSLDEKSKLRVDENGFIIYTAAVNEVYCMGYTGSATNITIPEGVTQIYQYAFYGKESITSITIPISVSVTSIGTYAFSNCSGLTSFTIEAISPPPLGSDAFYSTNNCPIYVPSTSVSAYKAATNWKNYSGRIDSKP